MTDSPRGCNSGKFLDDHSGVSEQNGKTCAVGWCNVIHGKGQLSARCTTSLRETYCLESGAALKQSAVHMRGAVEFSGKSETPQKQKAPLCQSDILSLSTRWKKKHTKKYANRMSWLYIICMLARPGSEEAHRSSMKTIRNWVGSNTSGMQVKNCTNGCGEMLLADLCWHLSAGCSRVHRLLHRGWIPPHTAVCKELFPSPGIICGSVRWDIYSFWHGREKWEHLKGLICHSLSWEEEKNVLPPRSLALRHPGLGYCASF